MHLRRWLIASTSLALALGLMPAAGLTAATAEPVTTAAQQPASDSVDEPVDEPVDIEEPDNVLLTRISIGPGNPVEGARVTLLDSEGRELAQARSGANGQAVLFAEERLPRVVEVRALGGAADILDEDQIRMRAWHNTGRFDIVHVNPYSTLEAACAAIADPYNRVRCENTIRRFFSLPKGVDYSYEADVSGRGLQGLDVNMLALEIRNRDTTLWEHSVEMAREALAGEKYEYEREPRQSAAALGVADDAVIGPQAAPLAGILLAGFAKAVASGAAQRIGGFLADKLLIGLGFMSPPAENDSATREDIEQLRQDLSEIKESLARVEAQLTGIRDSVAKLADAAKQSDYAAQRAPFVQQSAALERISRYFEYMLEFGECAQSSPDAERCANRTPPTAPRGGIGLELCSRPGEGDTRWARGLLAQCAYLMNAIEGYTDRYEVNSGTNVLAGSSNVSGLIQLSQWAQVSFRQDNIITPGNQQAVKAIGAFWMNQWSYDTLIWWMAGEEPRLLPLNVEPGDVLEHAEATKDRIQVASADTTGEFFAQDLPANCGANFVFDARTGRPYAIASPNPVRGDTNHMRGLGLVVGDVCDGSRIWAGVDPARIEADGQGRMAGYLGRATGVPHAYAGNTAEGDPRGRCFGINLEAVLEYSFGLLGACLRVSMSPSPAITDAVCTGVIQRGRLGGFLRGRFGLAERWERRVDDCFSPIALPQKIRAGLCVAGTPPYQCRDWREVEGPITDRRGNAYGAPDHPTLLSALPFDWMSVPAFAAGKKLRPSMSNQFFATRPLASGEVYLPRL